MTRKQKRLTVIGIIGAVLSSSVLLVMFALNDEIVFFYEPTAVTEEGKVSEGQYFRLGGLVKEGSIKKDGIRTDFVITDLANDVAVTTTDILPDLFRENQGVVAEGRLDAKGVFEAEKVLAKHDENYMPREVAETLKKQGIWEGNEQGKAQPEDAESGQTSGQNPGQNPGTNSR